MDYAPDIITLLIIGYTMFLKDRITRTVTIQKKDGTTETIRYRNKDLELERNEKSALSTQGYKVKKIDHGVYQQI